MKKLLIATFFLLIAAVLITVVYFKNLNLPGKHPSKVLQAIPDDAVLVFEFNNDAGFYDIFKGNTLFPSIIGEAKNEQLNTLRRELLLNPLLKPFFEGRHLFISLHAEKNDFDFLLTSPLPDEFKPALLDTLAKKGRSDMLINQIGTGAKTAYTIYLNDVKKRFYLVYRPDHILAGSFSKELAEKSLQYVPKKDGQGFVPLPDQQNSNSLANIYINYKQLSALSDALFTDSRYNDLFKNFRSLPAFASLTLNYKSDALMFSGFTSLPVPAPASYLALFANQQPVVNSLKDIFPSTTAYSIAFSVSDVQKFEQALAQYQNRSGLNNEKSKLFKQIKTETGIQLNAEFNKLLGSEFALVTTRFQEKLAIISVKDGSALRPFMVNVSHMVSDDRGQLKYNKLPYFLLGDAFSILNRPYFMIIDNYLIFASTEKELSSYYDSYANRKFLSKMAEYNEFEGLLAERCNVAFFIQFKNALPMFKRDLSPSLYDTFENGQPGWKDYYAASYQFTASEKDYYTNFCMRLAKKDTIVH